MSNRCDTYNDNICKEKSGSQADSNSQKLEDQNIFILLGVQNLAEEEKEEYLALLEDDIWQDFFDHDVQYLIPTEQHAELRNNILSKPDMIMTSFDEAIVFLEKLIPDLEDIMLEKALELKVYAFLWRLEKIQELYSDDQEEYKAVAQARALSNDNKWASAAELVSGLHEMSYNSLPRGNVLVQVLRG